MGYVLNLRSSILASYTEYYKKSTENAVVQDFDNMLLDHDT